MFSVDNENPTGSTHDERGLKTSDRQEWVVQTFGMEGADTCSRSEQFDLIEVGYGHSLRHGVCIPEFGLDATRQIGQAHWPVQNNRHNPRERRAEGTSSRPCASKRTTMVVKPPG